MTPELLPILKTLNKFKKLFKCFMADFKLVLYTWNIIEFLRSTWLAKCGINLKGVIYFMKIWKNVVE